MGWKKGVPRKGHVNKDGTKHASWGKRVHPFRGRPAAKVNPEPLKKRGRKPKFPDEKKWTTKLTNKGYDPCPRCGFPEAYGGYCDECGWMLPVRYGRVT